MMVSRKRSTPTRLWIVRAHIFLESNVSTANQNRFRTLISETLFLTLPHKLCFLTGSSTAVSLKITSVFAESGANDSMIPLMDNFLQVLMPNPYAYTRGLWATTESS